MGIGFMVVIVLLAGLLGLFARQALANVDGGADMLEEEDSEDTVLSRSELPLLGEVAEGDLPHVM